MHRYLIGAMIVLGWSLSPGIACAAPPTYHVQKSISVGGDGGWDYLTADRASHRLYISRGTHVVVVDLEQEKVVGDIPNTPGVHGIALAPRLGRGFTSNGRENTVTVFDVKTLKEISRIKVGSNPDCILYDRPSNRVFTFNGGGGDATAIDAAEGKVVGTVALGGRPEFAVSDGKGEVFVNIEDKSEIVGFDAKTLAVKSRWSISPGDGPSGLAMDRQHRRLFSVCGNGMMVVVNADTGKVVATPAIGKGPDAAAYDPSSGNAFSSNGEDGTLTVIHETSPDQFEAAGTIPTKAGARTMALDPSTHNILLVTAKPLAAQAGAQGRRRNYEPGSFVVLVVAP